MPNDQPDWTTFTKRIVVNAPLELVYSAWAVPAKIESWFLEKATYKSGNDIHEPGKMVREGDTFIWKWNNWDFEEEGQILHANNKDHISFTFGKGGKVSVKLQEKGNSTEIVLTQEQIPTDDKSKHDIYVGCATGWTFWLANLKIWLEYNITIHEKGLQQTETKNLVNS